MPLGPMAERPTAACMCRPPFVAGPGLLDPHGFFTELRGLTCDDRRIRPAPPTIRGDPRAFSGEHLYPLSPSWSPPCRPAGPVSPAGLGEPSHDAAGATVRWDVAIALLVSLAWSARGSAIASQERSMTASLRGRDPAVARSAYQRAAARVGRPRRVWANGHLGYVAVCSTSGDAAGCRPEAGPALSRRCSPRPARRPLQLLQGPRQPVRGRFTTRWRRCSQGLRAAMIHSSGSAGVRGALDAPGSASISRAPWHCGWPGLNTKAERNLTLFCWRGSGAGAPGVAVSPSPALRARVADRSASSPPGSAATAKGRWNGRDTDPARATSERSSSRAGTASPRTCGAYVTSRAVESVPPARRPRHCGVSARAAHGPTVHFYAEELSGKLRSLVVFRSARKDIFRDGGERSVGARVSGDAAVT
jgi:hypothetical protein